MYPPPQACAAWGKERQLERMGCNLCCLRLLNDIWMDFTHTHTHTHTQLCIREEKLPGPTITVILVSTSTTTTTTTTTTTSSSSSSSSIITSMQRAAQKLLTVGDVDCTLRTLALRLALWDAGCNIALYGLCRTRSAYGIMWYERWQIPFGDHSFKLERCREDQHGPCARMTRTHREVWAMWYERWQMQVLLQDGARSNTSNPYWAVTFIPMPMPGRVCRPCS